MVSNEYLGLPIAVRSYNALAVHYKTGCQMLEEINALSLCIRTLCGVFSSGTKTFHAQIT